MADTDKISLIDRDDRPGGANKQTSESRIFGIGKPPKIKIERLKHQDYMMKEDG